MENLEVEDGVFLFLTPLADLRTQGWPRGLLGH